MDAIVSPQPMPYVLPGNNFLAHFHMTRQGNEMVLERRCFFTTGVIMTNHAAVRPTPQATRIGKACAALMVSSTALCFQTAQAAGPALYVQYGAGQHSVSSWNLGINLPWRNWQYALRGGVVAGHWDVWGGRWHAPLHGSHRNTWVIGASPVLRWQGSGSLWFAQAGLGVSWAINQLHTSDRKRFSTRYNFASHIGAGRAFGAQRQHEWLLRLEHHSNANIKRPNPGEDFLQFRYAYRF